MIARNLTRRPVRAALSVLGIALAVAILIVGRYFVDAIQYIADVQFRVVQRDDVTVTFHEPLPPRVRYDLDHLPGILREEPFRAVPVRLRFEHRTRRTALIGLEPSSTAPPARRSFAAFARRAAGRRAADDEAGGHPGRRGAATR